MQIISCYRVILLFVRITEYFRFWRQPMSSCVGNLSVTATTVITYTPLPMDDVWWRSKHQGPSAKRVSTFLRLLLTRRYTKTLYDCKVNFAFLKKSRSPAVTTETTRWQFNRLGWPILILLGIRLGIDGVNPIYYDTTIKVSFLIFSYLDTD